MNDDTPPLGHTSGGGAEGRNKEANAPLDRPAPPVKSFPQRSARERKGLRAAQSIYSGRDRLGHVEQRANGRHSFNRLGKSLGIHASRAEAIDAIGKALRGGE